MSTAVRGDDPHRPKAGRVRPSASTSPGLILPPNPTSVLLGGVTLVSRRRVSEGPLTDRHGQTGAAGLGLGARIRHVIRRSGFAWHSREVTPVSASRRSYSRPRNDPQQYHAGQCSAEPAITRAASVAGTVGSETQRSSRIVAAGPSPACRIIDVRGRVDLPPDDDDEA